MSATHFDPYGYYDEPPEKTSCGVYPAEDEYKSSGSFKHVDCGRCLAMKEKLLRQHESNEQHMVNQMGDMAEFMSKKNDNG